MKKDELLKQIIEDLRPLIQAEVERILATKDKDQEPGLTGREDFKTRSIQKCKT